MTEAPGLNLFTLATGLGVLLLLWAFAVRRSRTDSILIAIGGLIFLFVGLRPVLAPNSYLLVGILPELVAGIFGLVLLLRAFFTRLGALHRIGFAGSGCLMMIPALLVAGVIALFAMGSGHDRRPHDNRAEPAAGNAAYGEAGE